MRSGLEQAVASKKESGSAILEFLLLALPLFLPLVIFMTQVSHKSQIEFDANNLARQLVRAFITSPSSEVAPLRISKVEQVFEEAVLKPHGVVIPATIAVNCSASPCLTPGARVEVSVQLKSVSSSTQASAEAVEYVDQWKSS